MFFYHNYYHSVSALALSPHSEKNDNFSLWLYNQIIKCIVPSLSRGQPISTFRCKMQSSPWIFRWNDKMMQLLGRWSALPFCQQGTFAAFADNSRVHYLCTKLNTVTFLLELLIKNFQTGESRLNSFSLLSQIAWIISFFRWNVYCTILYAFSSELLTIFQLLIDDLCDFNKLLHHESNLN